MNVKVNNLYNGLMRRLSNTMKYEGDVVSSQRGVGVVLSGKFCVISRICIFYLDIKIYHSGINTYYTSETKESYKILFDVLVRGSVCEIGHLSSSLVKTGPSLEYKVNETYSLSTAGSISTTPQRFSVCPGV